MSAGTFRNAETEAQKAREAADPHPKSKDVNWRAKLKRKGTNDSNHSQ